MGTVSEQDRWIACDGCFNVRDVGGYETRDGARTRWRALLRSDNLCSLTADGLATFQSLGVRTIVDVRGMAEAASLVHPFGTGGLHAGSVEYRHWPLRDPDDRALERAVEAAPTMIEGYRLNLKHCAPRLAEIARVFADAPAGGVLIHCHVGKDRTGIAIAVLLALCDVPAETIVRDYALSEGYLRPLYESLRTVGSVGAWDAWRSEPETMRLLLDDLERVYGGAGRYLRVGGLTEDEIARVRARLRDA
jgi:protein tyrosine/serine phosphatase